MTTGRLILRQRKNYLQADLHWDDGTVVVGGRLLRESVVNGTRFYAAKFGRRTDVLQVTKDIDGFTFDVMEVFTI